MKRFALILTPALLAVALGGFALTGPSAVEPGVELVPATSIVLDPCLEACADQLNYCMSRCGFGCYECWEQFQACQAACKNP